MVNLYYFIGMAYFAAKECRDAVYSTAVNASLFSLLQERQALEGSHRAFVTLGQKGFEHTARDFFNILHPYTPNQKGYNVYGAIAKFDKGSDAYNVVYEAEANTFRSGSMELGQMGFMDLIDYCRDNDQKYTATIVSALQWSQGEADAYNVATLDLFKNKVLPVIDSAKYQDIEHVNLTASSKANSGTAADLFS
tara:strand:+ start:433 stop:1014 length:582 start_codon:yes stop_codon:yes gene_type:complete